jgi:hypothetical protein
MQIHENLRLAAGTALLALLSCACTRYGFERQEIGLHHDAPTDAVELVVVSHGLLETEAASASVVAEVAGGKRHVILVDWPFEFPLDEMEEELRGSADPLAARALRFVQGIAVAEAGVWVDQEGERSLYQRISLPHASEGLALLNEWINRSCLEEKSSESIARQWGAASGELFAAHVGAGKSWFSFEEGALVLHVPISPDGAARSLEELLRGVADEDEPLLSFAPALTALSVADGVATLTFGPDASGWVRLRLELSKDKSAQPWVPPPGFPLLVAPPPEIARFLDSPEPKRGR